MRFIALLGRAAQWLAAGSGWLIPTVPYEVTNYVMPGERPTDQRGDGKAAAEEPAKQEPEKPVAEAGSVWHPEGFSGAPPTPTERRLWADLGSP